MKISTTILTTALVFTGLAAIAPAVGAIDVGCVRADGSGVAQVVAVPGALFLNWSPECVIIPNGGSVVWTNADGAPVEAHGAEGIVDGCFDLGRLTLPGTQQKLRLDYFEGVLFTEETRQNGVTSSGICDSSFVESENVLELTYMCVLHGDSMTSKIIVEL